MRHSVNFTQKELILQDMDKRRSENLDYRFAKSEKKILFVLVGSLGCTVSNISKFISDDVSAKKTKKD